MSTFHALSREVTRLLATVCTQRPQHLSPQSPFLPLPPNLPYTVPSSRLRHPPSFPPVHLPSVSPFLPNFLSSQDHCFLNSTPRSPLLLQKSVAGETESGTGGGPARSRAPSGTCGSSRLSIRPEVRGSGGKGHAGLARPRSSETFLWSQPFSLPKLFNHLSSEKSRVTSP